MRALFWSGNDMGSMSSGGAKHVFSSTIVPKPSSAHPKGVCNTSYDASWKPDSKELRWEPK